MNPFLNEKEIMKKGIGQIEALTKYVGNVDSGEGKKDVFPLWKVNLKITVGYIIFVPRFFFDSSFGGGAKLQKNIKDFPMIDEISEGNQQCSLHGKK